MDSDLWTSRLAAAKRQYSLQHHQSSHLGFNSFSLILFFGFFFFIMFGFLGSGLFWILFKMYKDSIFLEFWCLGLVFLDRLSIDDFEVEEELRPDFPCPYCYEDYDIASLCSHLEDEHSFESKVVVSVEKSELFFFWLISYFFFLGFVNSLSLFPVNEHLMFGLGSSGCFQLSD